MVERLAAAVLLAQAGLRVEVHASDTAGGATRSGELTLPWIYSRFRVGGLSLAVSSPFFRQLPLAQYGLQCVWPSASLAHPFDDGTALTVERRSTIWREHGSGTPRLRTLYVLLVENWPGNLV